LAILLACFFVAQGCSCFSFFHAAFFAINSTLPFGVCVLIFYI
jgi:hypothetical protein